MNLTKREIEILSLVAQGLSSKECADHLWLKTQTVKNHLANIYDKSTQDSWWNAFESIRLAFPVRQRVVIPLSGQRQIILSYPIDITALEFERLCEYLELHLKFMREDAQKEAA